jgi:hypothetical protein
MREHCDNLAAPPHAPYDRKTVLFSHITKMVNTACIPRQATYYLISLAIAVSLLSDSMIAASVIGLGLVDFVLIKGAVDIGNYAAHTQANDHFNTAV